MVDPTKQYDETVVARQIGNLLSIFQGQPVSSTDQTPPPIVPTAAPTAGTSGTTSTGTSSSRRISGGGSSYSDAFFSSVLQRIGAPVTPSNLAAMHAWANAEGSATRENNPFNTTLFRQGATAWNSFGPNGQYHVWIYPDEATGIEATAATIMQSNMAPILNALKAGNNANAVGAAVGQTGWGTGSFTVG